MDFCEWWVSVSDGSLWVMGLCEWWVSVSDGFLWVKESLKWVEESGSLLWDKENGTRIKVSQTLVKPDAALIKPTGGHLEMDEVSRLTAPPPAWNSWQVRYYLRGGSHPQGKRSSWSSGGQAYSWWHNLINFCWANNDFLEHMNFMIWKFHVCFFRCWPSAQTSCGPSCWTPPPVDGGRMSTTS